MSLSLRLPLQPIYSYVFRTYCRQAATLDPRPFDNDPKVAAAFKEKFGRLGLASDLHQRQLLHDYVEVHSWALQTLTTILIYEHTRPGSTHWDAVARSTNAIRFVLKLNPDLASSGPNLDPAHAFFLKEYSVVDRAGDWSAELSESWVEGGREGGHYALHAAWGWYKCGWPLACAT